MTITSFNVENSTFTRRKGNTCNKKCVFISIVIIVLCMAVIAAVLNTIYKKRDGADKDSDKHKLIPPNPEQPLPASVSALRTFNKGAVCSDAAPCSSIGRDILVKNGSAVDAAIAAMFCNGIVNMHSMGLGGGFLMTVYTREEKKAVTLNAREAAPLKATENMYDKDPEKSKKGALASGVPGELRGYWSAYKKFGKLPWKELIQPTIDLCEKGYNISESQYHSLFTNSYIKDDEILRELFINKSTGEFVRRGSLIKPTIYCDTLKLIAENGGDELYNGTLADKLVEDIQKLGGIISKKDLENYQPIWEDAISVKIKQDILYSAPPPGSGVLLGFILNILQQYNFTSDSINGINNTVSTYHKIIETFKYAFAERTELGDPSFNNITELLNNLTSSEYATSVRENINETVFNDPEHYGAIFYQKGNHGTAHLSILAPNGDAVSVTSTVNLYFGAGVTSKQTGIILNSGMNDFSTSVLNYFGLPGSPANKIEPGKRPLSSMTPSIIVDENADVKMVIGASGGTKIPTAITMVIMRALWFGQNIKQAVDAPRIHHQLFPMEIEYEYGVLQQIIDGLEKLGHKTNRYRDRGSIICALLKIGNKITANSDYRKGGDVYGI